MPTMSTISDFSVPDIPPLSPGSSVSTRLQDEYDELLKFAVVVPNYDPQKLPSTLTDIRDSFLQHSSQKGRSAQSNGDLREPAIGHEMRNGTREPAFGHEVKNGIREPAMGHEMRDRTREPAFGHEMRNGTREPVFGHEVRNGTREPAMGHEMRSGTREPDDDELSDATDVTPINEKLSSRCSLPDFGGQSPIRSHQDSGRNFPDNVNNSHNSDTQQHSRIEIGEYERVYTATVDPDVSKIETLMDQWCLDLKRNILAEFSQSKIRIVEQGRQQLVKEQERHASEKIKLLEEMNSLKELLATYEKSIERKDQVISNLTNALQKQKDKSEMTRRFCEWKIRHNDHKREIFCTNLAKQFYERKLSQKVWAGWHGVIETKWKQRIEKACQAKAQEVCVQLTNDYEGRLAQAKEELDTAKLEISKLHAERERYEEMMKKAFMRGVCALNLEAMTIFQQGEEKENRVEPVTNNQISEELAENMKSSLVEKDYSTGKSLPQETLQTGSTFSSTQERIVTSQGSRPTTQSTLLQSKPQQSKTRTTSAKVLTTKITSKIDSGKSKPQFTGPLAPPMSSVVVERHQPVTKQTMGHAIAGKYVRQSSGSKGERSGVKVHRTIAGQGQITSNIQTVKHVE